MRQQFYREASEILRDDILARGRKAQIRHLAKRFTLLVLFGAIRAHAVEPHFIVLDPGHSHAAAVFEKRPQNVSRTVDVYAPPGPDVQQFLNSLDAMNGRSAHPTDWDVHTYIGPGFEAKMLLERPGNIVVITGRNNGKIGSILSSVQKGQNVIADKPWIIERTQLPLLEQALRAAAQRGVVAYDCMTERFNVAYQIQRELMRDSEIFGSAARGSEADPAVVLHNIHSIAKYSRGQVNLRPSWFFDVRQQGQAVADVGTHLVDLALWTLFPEQAIDYRSEVKVLSARRTPVYLTLPEFQRVTGEKSWPTFLNGAIEDGRLKYDCNNTAVFSVRGVYAGISDRWEYESAGALSDTYLVQYRGTRATIRVRQSKLENYVPQLDIVPAADVNREDLIQALRQRLQAMSASFPNLALRSTDGGIRVEIPASLRERGGSTFQQLIDRFLGYVDQPGTLPGWEAADMTTKYYITTTAAEMAKAQP